MTHKAIQDHMLGLDDFISVPPLLLLACLGVPLVRRVTDKGNKLTGQHSSGTATPQNMHRGESGV